MIGNQTSNQVWGVSWMALLWWNVKWGAAVSHPMPQPCVESLAWPHWRVYHHWNSWATPPTQNEQAHALKQKWSSNQSWYVDTFLGYLGTQLPLWYVSKVTFLDSSTWPLPTNSKKVSANVLEPIIEHIENLKTILLVLKTVGQMLVIDALSIQETVSKVMLPQPILIRSSSNSGTVLATSWNSLMPTKWHLVKWQMHHQMWVRDNDMTMIIWCHSSY